MEVRCAFISDLTEVSELVERAVKNAPYGVEVPKQRINELSATFLLRPHSDTKTYLLLNDDKEAVGIITGLVCDGDNIFAACRVAAEYVWYVDPDYRTGTGAMRLLKAYEEWAKEVGCDMVSMSLFESENRDQLTRLYKKRGYTTKEEVFSKAI
jgi:GNAT superfamily N-acetyltransferase